MKYNQEVHDQMRELAHGILHDIKNGLVDNATLTETEELMDIMKKQVA